LTAIGFGHYIFGGTRPDGSPINPAILALVVLHSSAIFARWVAHISLVLGNVGFLVGC
jgi:Na+-translocating ferredoxin:NAD+ oxidoreductase RnfD subunit